MIFLTDSVFKTHLTISDHKLKVQWLAQMLVWIHGRSWEVLSSGLLILPLPQDANNQFIGFSWYNLIVTQSIKEIITP